MKTAFLLTGEGAKGSYQAGQLKLLDDANVKPDLICGISSGSINAVGYSYLGPTATCNQWKKISSISDVYTFKKFTFFLASGVFATRPMDKFIKDSVMKNKPSVETVISVIHENSGVVCKINNMQMKPEIFAEYAVSAIVIPGIIESRNRYFDAGARELCPLKYAIDQGCDNIIIITGRPLSPPVWFPQGGVISVLGIKLLKCIEYGLRFVDLMLYEILIRDIYDCLKKNSLPGYKNINLTVYGPKAHLYDSMEFSMCNYGLTEGLKELHEIEL